MVLLIVQHNDFIHYKIVNYTVITRQSVFYTSRWSLRMWILFVTDIFLFSLRQYQASLHLDNTELQFRGRTGLDTMLLTSRSAPRTLWKSSKWSGIWRSLMWRNIFQHSFPAFNMLLSTNSVKLVHKLEGSKAQGPAL